MVEPWIFRHLQYLRYCLLQCKISFYVELFNFPFFLQVHFLYGMVKNGRSTPQSLRGRRWWHRSELDNRQTHQGMNLCDRYTDVKGRLQRFLSLVNNVCSYRCRTRLPTKRTKNIQKCYKIGIGMRLCRQICRTPLPQVTIADTNRKDLLNTLKSETKMHVMICQTIVIEYV